METRQPFSTPRLLLMEDEPLARWVALKALEETGAQVLEAASCAEARRLLETFDFELLILDYRLPDGLGTAVAAYARETGYGRPIILLSADAGEFSAGASSEAAFSAVLQKPLNVEELQRTVREQIQAGADPAGEPADPAENTVWVDRFRLIAMPEQTDARRVAAIACTPKDKGWIALDLRQTVAIELECAPLLNTLAEQCLAQGGRLALMGAPPEVAHMVQEWKEPRIYDLVPDTRALEALSRRLSSFCERLSLLDSVVPRDSEAMPSP